MRLYNTIAARVRVAVGISTVALIPLLGACNATDNLLEAVDPDLIRSGERQLRGRRARDLQRRARATEDDRTEHGRRRQHAGSSAACSRTSGPRAPRSCRTTRRISARSRSTTARSTRCTVSWHGHARRPTRRIRGLKQWRPTEATRIAEMYFVRAYAEQQLANDLLQRHPAVRHRFHRHDRLRHTASGRIRVHRGGCLG